MAKVSIIIPVCNVENYLRECLDSVCNQTLKDIEIICVDDGSTDSSGEILDEYAGKDGRFRVVHKQNEGYGKAMNMGMKLATAPYVGIVESDDMIRPHMYESLLAVMEKEHVDMIKADFYEFYDDGEGGYIEEYIPLTSDIRYQELYETVFNIREHDEVFYFEKYTWDGLYDREFLQREQIVYNETPGASYQDNGFWFQTLIKAKSIYFEKQAFYRYRIDNISASMRSKAKVFSICNEYDFIRDILDGMGEAGKAFYRCAGFIRMKACIHHIPRVADEYKEALTERIKDEFLLSVRRGEVDASLYTDFYKQRIFDIVADPKAYAQKVKQKRNIIENIVSDYDTVILYGAGKIGRMTRVMLKEGRVHTKIKFFAVTDMGDNPETVAGVPVKKISDLRKYGEKALVIISVGKSFIQEVEGILKEQGFKHYVFSGDLA